MAENAGWAEITAWNSHGLGMVWSWNHEPRLAADSSGPGCAVITGWSHASLVGDLGWSHGLKSRAEWPGAGNWRARLGSAASCRAGLVAGSFGLYSLGFVGLIFACNFDPNALSPCKTNYKLKLNIST